MFRPCNAVAFLTILFIWASGIPAKAQYDPCAELIDSAGVSVSDRWNIRNFFTETPTDSPSVGIGDRKFYVTVRAGRFANVSCDEKQYEFQEMYPLGIMVRPLYRVQLPFYEAAGLGKPILVVTEYGQRKIIPESDIAPIVDGASYFFADSSAKAMICRDAADCPGNAEQVCADNRCRYDISPFFGYAVAETEFPDTRKSLVAYRRYPTDEIQRRSIMNPQEIVDSRKELCTPFPVKAYLPGGELTQPTDSYLTLCAKRAGIDGATADGVTPFKIVDIAAAQRVFGEALSGSFHRWFGTATPESASIRSVMRRLTVTKPCNVKIENVGSLSATGGMSLKASAGFAEFNVGGTVDVTTELTFIESEKEYILFSRYFVQQDISADVADDEDLWVFTIAFRSACVGSLVSQPTSLTIFYEPLQSGSLEIGVTKDLFKGYQQDWSADAYTANVNASNLKNGLFWTITDHIAYFNWRDTIRRYVENTPDTRNFLDRQRLDERPMVRDFLVYLVLAAAFDHYSPPRL